MIVPAPLPDGRWGGALTKRPLPDASDELDALSLERRTTLAKIWFTQAATEARVANSFKIVHGSLVALRADSGLITTAERAIDDEHRHTGLCMEMAKRYANRDDLPPVPELPFAHPTHPEAQSEAERHLLYVMGQCVFNETFACAYLSLARDAAESPLARAALSELLSDEIDHARIGWAYLETAPKALKEKLPQWIHALAVANLGVWRALELNTDADLAYFGVPAAEAIEHALVSALTEVIVPGFGRSGVGSKALDGWVRAGAPAPRE